MGLLLTYTRNQAGRVAARGKEFDSELSHSD